MREGRTRIDSFQWKKMTLSAENEVDIRLTAHCLEGFAVLFIGEGCQVIYEEMNLISD